MYDKLLKPRQSFRITLYFCGAIQDVPHKICETVNVTIRAILNKTCCINIGRLSTFTWLRALQCFRICPYSLLTPRSRVLLEKLDGSQLVKKFPAIYRTRMFITAFTSTRHLSLSWASSNKPIPPYSTSRRLFLILSSHLRLVVPSGLLSRTSPYPHILPPEDHS